MGDEKYRLQVPDGVYDTLTEECYNKRELEQSIRHSFFISGYDEVETPGFEYFDVFANGIGAVKQEKLIKFFDEHGRILALRPEFTMQIARMAATKITQFPARICYISNAYGIEEPFYSSQREFTQAGVELLGLCGAEADAEVLAVAIEALQGVGLHNFQIDIGQVEYFKGLMEEAGLTREESEELRGYVDQKDDLAIELFLKDRSIGSVITETIRELPALYGGKEVLQSAIEVSSNPRCVRAIKNLSDIYDILSDFGFASYISIDLGMLQSIDYYSGLIFKGYASGIGNTILSGGRYDHLIQKFGKDIPATGCAMGIKRILIALERQGKLIKIPEISYVVAGEKHLRGKIYQNIQTLRIQGKRVQPALHLDRQGLQEYAERICAQAIYID